MSKVGAVSLVSSVGRAPPVTVMHRRGVFYGDKDPKLEVNESVYFLTMRKGSMILVNWKQRFQNATK